LRRDRSPARAADLDVLEGNYGQANRLLINDGSGGFTEDTSSAFAIGTDSTRTIFAADIDGDGGACARRHAARPHAARGARVAGLSMRIPLTRSSLSPTHTHIVSDALAAPLPCAADRSPTRVADLDVLEGNDGQANRLLINDGSGGLTEDTSSALAVGTDGTFTIFAADIDGDGGACARRHAARPHAARGVRVARRRMRMPLTRSQPVSQTHTHIGSDALAASLAPRIAPPRVSQTSTSSRETVSLVT